MNVPLMNLINNQNVVPRERGVRAELAQKQTLRREFRLCTSHVQHIPYPTAHDDVILNSYLCNKKTHHHVLLTIPYTPYKPHVPCTLPYKPNVPCTLPYKPHVIHTIPYTLMSHVPYPISHMSYIPYPVSHMSHVPYPVSQMSYIPYPIHSCPIQSTLNFIQQLTFCEEQDFSGHRLARFKTHL